MSEIVELDRWLTVEQAAGVLGVSVTTVRRLYQAGHLPHRKVGRQVRFVPAELASWTGAPAPVSRRSTGRLADRLRDLDPYAA